PRLRRADTTSATCSGSRTPLIAKSKPLSASASAIPRPIPRLPPVTRATRLEVFPIRQIQHSLATDSNAGSNSKQDFIEPQRHKGHKVGLRLILRVLCVLVVSI